MKKVGKGRLQLRLGGKHLILVRGRKNKSVMFSAGNLMDHEVEVFVNDLGESKRKRIRECEPRPGGLK
jgi:hypothetical protein